ncbi:sugar nucleotide-binding protein [Deinococcus hopiensis]|uniref:sugar nucleotide-binding protein n=1 Tax=Deinococcus hopiensis TaxID=309885 RepID=UPI00111C6DE9|nr:sugar nucleotide-binding protein [Deinococcus hopiensis]
MRLLMTGLNGTLGPKVARVFEQHGATCIGWNRLQTPPDDEAAGQAYLHGLSPDAIVHLAMGSEAWAARLARYAATSRIPFAFTSSVMVFEENPDGPHQLADAPTPSGEYGQYKMRCEQAILSANPQATVARIGWQIDPEATGNNMLAQLDGWQRDKGEVSASRLWRPACSFMEDTAAALWTLIHSPQAGVVHLDSNARHGYTFDQVALALAARFERDWNVVPTEAFRRDQRLIGSEELMLDLAVQLPTLSA